MLSRATALALGWVLAGNSAVASTVVTCDASVPRVLNVGLPYSQYLSPDEVKTRLRSFFDTRYVQVCPGDSLQINAALGSDYQIFDWLGRGVIDVAVVSALGMHLLLRDGVALVEFTPEEKETSWLATKTAKLASYRTDRPRPGPPRKAEADLALFREQLLSLARVPPPPGEPPAARLPTRIVFLNHLSTTGFLMPVEATHYWLEARLDRERVVDQTRHELRDAFWAYFFAHTCFRFSDENPGEAASCMAKRGSDRNAVATRVELEMTATPNGPEPVRDYLVMRAETAEGIFSPEAFSEAVSTLPPALGALFGRLQPPAKAVAPESAPKGRARSQRSAQPTYPAPEDWPEPPGFRSHVSADPYFGTRTFAFTMDESVRLLELHQQTSRQPHLALVLPGGGVKAAYQSGLIDELYGGGYLKNRLVPGGAAMAARPALDVESVIGTSGGALLGFFVARLDEIGPWNLSEILWAKSSDLWNSPTATAAKEFDPVDDHDRFLGSSQVFPFTDLLRYASLVAILLILGFALAAFSVGRRGWLSPPAQTENEGGRGPLLLALAMSLGATPLLVRWLSGDSLNEHVPDFEGLLFAILVGVAMFADQCLISRADREARETPRRSASLAVLIAGVLLIALPILGGYASRLLPQPEDSPEWTFPGPFLEAPIGAGLAYLTLTTLAAGLALVTLRQRRGSQHPDRETSLALLAVVGSTALAYLLLSHTPERELERLERMPVFFLGLVVTLAAALFSRLVRRHNLYLKVAQRAQDLSRTAGARWTAAIVVPTLAALVILDFTRPPAKPFRETTNLWELITTPSKLGAQVGAFAVTLGALLALIGFVLVLRDRRSRFRFENTHQYVEAVLLLVVTLALAVYAALFGISRLWPQRMTLFELTPAFWLGLLAVSAVASAGLLLWGYFGSRDSRLANHLRAALHYLTSRHPNGNLVERRFVRLGVIAVAGLAWWNFVVAPALYGNRAARAYFDEVDRRFGKQYEHTHGQPKNVYRLTAQLVAPANALKQDGGTRFVVAVPGSEPCPRFREPAGSGALWYLFHAVDQVHQHDQEQKTECVDLDLNDQCLDSEKDCPRDRLLGFVFASGSPFPIFPAHLVQPNPQAEKEALVDGGYTNNTPVEAAGKVGAEQVLIVNSSPSQCREEPPGWLRAGLKRVQGPLVSNTLRLPGFFFERSQQFDRRSRENLFVLSMSPSCEPDWPILSDFRGSVVGRMQRAALADLGRRIGIVESWGLPRFQVSQEIPERE